MQLAEYFEVNFNLLLLHINKNRKYLFRKWTNNPQYSKIKIKKNKQLHHILIGLIKTLITLKILKKKEVILDPKNLKI